MFHSACSPHIAAHLEGKKVDFDLMSAGLKKLQAKARYTLVEGFGGWRVPVCEQYTLANWVEQEKLPVILVVGIKFGCINHAHLTAEVIGYNAFIVKTLEHQLEAPKIGEIPYLANITSRDLSHYIDVNMLCTH